MTEQNRKGVWLSSKDAMKHLKISACELMHRREQGSLKFEKRGRAYFYYLLEPHQTSN
ncbi:MULTISPECIES: hypothetical protein [unclassified Pseudoalteromonas]|uniref:hypothetical protein n=1 Tax=unclassified Pseudoalteromonas TaxID=194690 RepID=UPI0013EEC3EB|nr:MULTISPECIES: hypothetical protein [unclassified Pseudoalteromonas]